MRTNAFMFVLSLAGIAFAAKADIISLAADAHADGSLAVECIARDVEDVETLAIALFDNGGRKFFEKSTAADFRATAHDFTVQKAFADFDVRNPVLWTDDLPNLYRAKVSLLTAKGDVLATASTPVAFRTVEIRREDGIYMNNRRIILKGLSVKGRLCAEHAAAIKALNANAAYLASDDDCEEFLSACDTLGVYVLAEISNPSNITSRVRAIAPHPCVILWGSRFTSKPNRWWRVEDGESEIRSCDPQSRAIVRIGQSNSLFSAPLSPLAGTHAGNVRDPLIYLPVNVSPVQGDLGGAASLEGQWRAVAKAQRAAGLFVGCNDDAIDWRSIPSANVIKSIFAPFRMDCAKGILAITNNSMRDLAQFSCLCETLDMADGSVKESIAMQCPVCPPGGATQIPVPDVPALRISILDAASNTVARQTFTIPFAFRTPGVAPVAQRPSWLRDVHVAAFARTNTVQAANGRRVLTGEFSYMGSPGDAASIEWMQFSPDDVLLTATVKSQSRTAELFGLVFAYSPESLVSVRRSCAGPETAWANRRASLDWGIWEDPACGFFANPRWIEIETTEGRICFTPVAGVNFIGVGAPAPVAHAHIFPDLGIGFYKNIPRAFLPGEQQTNAAGIGGETVFKIHIKRIASR
ncbi:MAG: hypothetical protein IJ802_03350 [Kiritimatiellae bacterium]|nr:hypothetical protein [Kiritimatiellia bacterium]